MADLENIIAASVAEASGTEIPSPDVETGNETETPVEETPAVETLESTETPETPEVKPEVPVADPSKPAETKPEKPVEKPVEKSQAEKDLEELGLHAPKEGERENRLPYSRVRKIAENFGKKVEARYTEQVTALTTERDNFKKVADNTANVDRLIKEDPDRYITMLAGIHPEYRKFLTPQAPAAKPEEKPAAPVSQLGPRPTPDVKYEDGSLGYSPEQHEKLLDWVAASAREAAVKDAEERIGKRIAPFEQMQKQREEAQAEVGKVRSEVQDIYEQWGKELVDKHESEIVALMKANPTMRAKAATRQVLLSKLNADRNQIYQEVLKELDKRPAAAKIVPAATKPSKVTEAEVDPNADPITAAIQSSVAALRK